MPVKYTKICSITIILSYISNIWISSYYVCKMYLAKYPCIYRCFFKEYHQLNLGFSVETNHFIQMFQWTEVLVVSLYFNIVVTFSHSHYLRTVLDFPQSSPQSNVLWEERLTSNTIWQHTMDYFKVFFQNRPYREAKNRSSKPDINEYLNWKYP